MAVKLEIPTALRQFAGKQASVEFNAATVGEALKQLTGTYADLRKHLYAEDGRLRNFVNIYLNDEDIRYLQKEKTPVKPGDSLSIVPSVAGGAPTSAPTADQRVRAASEVDLSADEIKRYSRHLIMPYDVILDGTDNFPTRYLVNDACVLTGKPNAYGSIFRFEGQASVFATKDGPCYRCLYPEPPPPGLVPSCAEGGVLGVLPGVIGVIQATEAIKLVTGIGEPLIGRFLIYDALRMRFRELKVPKDPDCPVCGTHPTITRLIDYEQFCGIHPEPE